MTKKKMWISESDESAVIESGPLGSLTCSAKRGPENPPINLSDVVEVTCPRCGSRAYMSTRTVPGQCTCFECGEMWVGGKEG
jgi:hypothetical protein